MLPPFAGILAVMRFRSSASFVIFKCARIVNENPVGKITYAIITATALTRAPLYSDIRGATFE